MLHLGIYRYDGGADTVYFAVGGDYGVDFFTAYFPRLGITASALGNTDINTYPLLDQMLAAEQCNMICTLPEKELES